MSVPSISEQVNIRGVPVNFPFVPYKCQIDYMECVITSLQESQNAMLESPTGTGKTLCLLASALAWRQEKVKQLEAAHLDLAEAAGLFVEGGVTVENMEKANIPKPRAPVIVYATRTHSQIAQVVSEFHRTSYASGLNVCVLGSRAQMCIHPTVAQTRGGVSALNRNCNAHVQRSTCVFHNNVDLYKQSLPRTRDIEDLVLWGRRHSACPYFIAKNQQSIADIVFVPYNYIIDPLIRRSLNFELKGAAVIFDEAHNLEQVASDAASFDLSSSDLKLCLTQIQQCLDACGGSLAEIPADLTSNPDTRANNSSAKGDVEPPLAPPIHHALLENQDNTSTTSTVHAMLLKEAITALLNEFSNTAFSGGANVKVGDGKWVFELFERIGINSETAPAYIKTMDQVALLMQDGSPLQIQSGAMVNSATTQNAWAASNALSSFSEALHKMFMSGVPISETGGHFKSVLQRESATRLNFFQSKNKGNYNGNEGQHTVNTEESKTTRSGPFDRQYQYKLSLWCFYPGLAMQSLMNTGLRSLIVTSGTLSPLESFAYELSIPFPIRLENPHVIPTAQIWVGVLPTAVDGEPLNSAFTNRSAQYKRSLGHTLTNVARISPGGLLIFFPSYKLMEECIEEWKSGDSTSNVWSQICRYKQPVVEPRESQKLKLAMKEFYDKVDHCPPGEVTGAVFFAVCRGKVSEGLDFSNNYGRTVVVTGLPFAQNMDQKVKMKREYLDQQVATKKLNPPETSSIHPDSTRSLIRSTDKPLTGQDWYAQSAWRAVNQAIGRVIRHRNDYGAILFLDERFVSSASSHLSKWLRPHVHTMRAPGPLFQAIAKFFQANAHLCPSIAAAKVGSTSNGTKEVVSTESTPISRGALVSHITAANSRRKSVFDTRNSVSTAPSETTHPVNSAGDPEKSKDKPQQAAKLLSLAKAQLTAEAFQTFQSTMKLFKSRQMKRSELLVTLSTQLAAYPDFLKALDDYLGRASSKPDLPVEPLSAPSTPQHPHLLATQPKLSTSVTHSPNIHQTASSAPNSPFKDIPSNQGVSLNGTSLEHPSPPPVRLPVDAASLEILTPPQNVKKRSREVDCPEDVEMSIPKRNVAFSVGNSASCVSGTTAVVRPVVPARPSYGSVVLPSVVPDDSVLDLSIQASQESLVSKPDPVVVHSMASPSLEMLLDPIQEVPKKETKPQEREIKLSQIEPKLNEPVLASEAGSSSLEFIPTLYRKSSSDLSPTTVNRAEERQQSGDHWARGLRRGNSGGLVSLVDSVTPSSATSQTKTAPTHTTPKKGYIDLITGKKVGSSPRVTPKRGSPPKPVATAILIPETATGAETEDPEEETLLTLETGNTSAECLICAKRSNDIQVAPCGHRCCKDCWQSWLKSKMECPFCRGRVRAKKLRNEDS